MGKYAALILLGFVVILVACGEESETVEETPAPKETDRVELPTSTPILPTTTQELPTDTFFPLEMLEELKTAQALPKETATPRPTFTPWPTPSTYSEVSWDGNECVVTGPSVVPVGNHGVIWKNHTDQFFNLVVRYLHDGHTFQDLLDLQGEPGRMFPRPSWVEEIEWTIRRDDPIGTDILTFHLNREGNYDIHFWNSNFLWICGPLTAVEEATE